MKFKYRGYTVHPHSIHKHEGKWYYQVTITTPLEAPEILDIPLHGECVCSSEEEVLEHAKQHAVSWIDEHHS